MEVTTSVGIRELKAHLSEYVGRVRNGQEVIVTDRGKPVARLTAVDSTTDRIAALIAAGIVQPPKAPRSPLPKPVKIKGTISDLVAEQRR